jgi:hypothetical protein
VLVIGKQWSYLLPSSACDARASLGSSTVSLRTDTRCRTPPPHYLNIRTAPVITLHITRHDGSDSTKPLHDFNQFASVTSTLQPIRRSPERQHEFNDIPRARPALDLDAKIKIPWDQAPPTVPTGTLEINRKPNAKSHDNGAWSSRHGVGLACASR